MSEERRQRINAVVATWGREEWGRFLYSWLELGKAADEAVALTYYGVKLPERP